MVGFVTLQYASAVELLIMQTSVAMLPHCSASDFTHMLHNCSRECLYYLRIAVALDR